MVGLMTRIGRSVSWRSRRVVREIRNGVRGHLVNIRSEETDVEPRITYPCYKSLDEYIDVERLKSLDGYLKRKVESFLRLGNAPNLKRAL